MWPSWEETLIIFAAAVLEGGVGFDFGLIAVPAIGALSGVRDAVVLLCLPNLGLGILKAIGGKAEKKNLKRLMPFIGAGGAGAAVGVFVLLSTPPVVLKWMAGGLALLFALYSLSWTRLQLDLRDETFFAYIAGFFSGGFTGFSYAGGPVSVIFLDSMDLQRGEMVKLVYIAGLAFAAVQAAALIGAGLLIGEAASRSALSLLPAAAGFICGRVIRGRIPSIAGYTGGLTLLVVAALALFIFGPGGWK